MREPLPNRTCYDVPVMSHPGNEEPPEPTGGTEENDAPRETEPLPCKSHPCHLSKARMEVTVKPWGREEMWAFVEGKYAAKTLHVRANHELSLKYHRQRHKTVWILQGEVDVEHCRQGCMQKERFTEGSGFVVPPGAVHGVRAVTECVLLEVSTTELEDKVRLEDRYCRPPGVRSLRG